MPTRDSADAANAIDEAVSGVALIDTSKPNIARVYDYWLGGKDNFAGDREEAERMLGVYPQAGAAGAREPAVFEPGCGMAGETGHPAVPRHRFGTAYRPEHAPGRAGG